MFLSTKNFKNKQLSKKLDHKKIGFFLISEIYSNKVYYFQLPKDICIQPVFNISFLEPVPPDVFPQTTFYHDDNKSMEYKIKSFIDCVKSWYFIKWKRHPDSENLWIFLEDLMNCKSKLKNIKKHGKKDSYQKHNKKNLIPTIQESKFKLISIPKSVDNILLICDGNIATNFSNLKLKETTFSHVLWIDINIFASIFISFCKHSIWTKIFLSISFKIFWNLYIFQHFLNQ